MALQELTRGSEKTADFQPATYRKRSDFFLGYQVVARNDVLLWPSDKGGDGNYYQWLGTLPKTVVPSSTPASSGGIGVSAWFNVGKGGGFAGREINIQTLGAVSGSNVTAILKAVLAAGYDAYAPAGTYDLTDMVSLPFLNQKIRGDGRFKTVFRVGSGMNMSVAGVFQSSGIAVEYEDLAIEFTQPDTVNRNLLIKYPAAITGIGVPGQRLTRCRISRAWIGLDWRDNTGQSSVQDLLMSAFFRGIWIDGAVDSIRLNDWHFWPSECTSNQTDAMKVVDCIGLYSGRADDLKVNNGLFFCGKPMSFFSGVRSNAGPTFGVITNTDLDGFSGIDMTSGDIVIIGGYQSTGNSALNKVNQSGGNLLMSGINFNIGAAFSENDPFMDISGPLTRFSLTGCDLRRFNYDVCLVRARAGATVIYNDNQIQHDPNVTYNYAFIYSDNNCRVTAQGNRASDLGSGAADFFRMPAGSDGSNDISGNTLFGHGMVFSGVQGRYAPNLNTVNFTGNFVTGVIKTMRFRGNLDAAGGATIAHEISQLNIKALTCSAVFKGASGETKNLVGVSVDGTNVVLVGGTANQPYKAVVTYTETPETW